MSSEKLNRVVRVFISSTFRDMANEREELIKYVFPELQRRLSDRLVEFVPVDLRWGITTEEAERGDVLSICLDEIDRCHPYFICFLGNRYGWVPESLDVEALKQQFSIENYSGKSVTELEIEYGALNYSTAETFSSFYFRGHDFSNQVESELRGEAGYVAEPDESVQSLELLKGRIRQSGYKVHEDYQNIKSFGELVLEDMWKVFDLQFPEQDVPTAIQRLRQDHDEFSSSRIKTYIAKQGYYDSLNQFMESGDNSIVLLGESGSGKSSLLANWAEKFEQEHAGVRVLKHFVGVSADSTDYIFLLKRIMEEINEYLVLCSGSNEVALEEVPAAPEDVVAVFSSWLAKIEGQDQLLIVIDALNQLEDRDGALDLGWLPKHLPENLKLVVSTLEGPCLDELKRRDWSELVVEPMAHDEVAQFINLYLGQYGKKLDAMQVECISQAPQTKNPLYLKTLLDELRLFGVFELLNEKIEYYLASQAIDDLFAKVLARIEADYERDCPGLTRDVMSYVWGSRYGLLEPELLDLLGDGNSPLPHAYWSPLHLALEEALVNRGGMLTFSHEFFRIAVEKRYLDKTEDKQATHLWLANYFESVDGVVRRAIELPWQLAKVGEWDRLCKALSYPEFIAEIWNANSFEAKSYWSSIEGNTVNRLITAYEPVLKNPENHVESAWQISSLLMETGYMQDAEPLLQFLLGYYRENDDQANLSGVLSNYASILYSRRDYDAAMALYDEAYQICLEKDDKDGLQRTIGNQALVLQARADLNGAMALYKEKESICRELANVDGIQRAIGNQAVIHQQLGDFDAAMQLYKEKERICREIENPDELQIALGNQAGVLLELGDSEGALSLHKEAEQIGRALGSRDAIQRALANQAVVHMNRGEPDLALSQLSEAELICRETENIEPLQRIIGYQASIYIDKTDYEKVIEKSAEQETICRRLNNYEGLSVALDNQSIALRETKQFERAMSCRGEELELCRSLGDSASLIVSLSNLALLLIDLGEMDEAVAVLSETETLAREQGDKKMLRQAVSSHAAIFMQKNNMNNALQLLMEEEILCQKLNDKESLRLCINNQARVFYDMGKQKKSIAMYQKSEVLCRENDYEEGLALALGNRAIILVNSKSNKNLKLARPVLAEACQLAEKLNLESSLFHLTKVRNYVAGIVG